MIDSQHENDEYVVNTLYYVIPVGFIVFFVLMRFSSLHQLLYNHFGSSSYHFILCLLLSVLFIFFFSLFLSYVVSKFLLWYRLHKADVTVEEQVSKYFLNPAYYVIEVPASFRVQSRPHSVDSEGRFASISLYCSDCILTGHIGLCDISCRFQLPRHAAFSLYLKRKDTSFYVFPCADCRVDLYVLCAGYSSKIDSFYLSDSDALEKMNYIVLAFKNHDVTSYCDKYDISLK